MEKYWENTGMKYRDLIIEGKTRQYEILYNHDTVKDTDSKLLKKFTKIAKEMMKSGQHATELAYYFASHDNRRLQHLLILNQARQCDKYKLPLTNEMVIDLNMYIDDTLNIDKYESITFITIYLLLKHAVTHIKNTD